ncbi:PREDICTED: uncharacterized protein LOC104816853 [Tarenaya hassleriana]|uniref:uncharacterized protein LOC104816853 n=1 Tax=Tarenaya hassleriana TaxID=28532 RepID=UPI00053C2EE8|nr:PREDICTED: uncharacterized protein LOC104816853 [Tarenaya hassleriana]
MSRLQWIFSGILLVAFMAAEAVLDDETQKTIDGICRQTKDYRFCEGIFVENLKTSSPSIKDLVNVTVGRSEMFSANTIFFISQLLRNVGSERDGLQMCADAYAKVNIAFSLAVSWIRQGQYSEVLELEESVSKDVEICKTDYDVPSYDVNPMIERNGKMTILMTMVRIVCHMLDL